MSAARSSEVVTSNALLTNHKKFFDLSAPSVGTAGPSRPHDNQKMDKAPVAAATGLHQHNAFVKSESFWEPVSVDIQRAAQAPQR